MESIDISAKRKAHNALINNGKQELKRISF